MSNLLSPTASSLSLLEARQGNGAAMQAAIKAAQAQRSAGSGFDEKTMAKIDETAQDFEAVFVAEMMKPMFEGISTEAPFGGGKGEEVFRGMLLQEYGKMIASTGSIGLSSSIKNEMIRMQEAANHAASDNNTQTSVNTNEGTSIDE